MNAVSRDGAGPAAGTVCTPRANIASAATAPSAKRPAEAALAMFARGAHAVPAAGPAPAARDGVHGVSASGAATARGYGLALLTSAGLLVLGMVLVATHAYRRRRAQAVTTINAECRPVKLV